MESLPNKLVHCQRISISSQLQLVNAMIPPLVAYDAKKQPWTQQTVLQGPCLLIAENPVLFAEGVSLSYLDLAGVYVSKLSRFYHPIKADQKADVTISHKLFYASGPFTFPRFFMFKS